MGFGPSVLTETDQAFRVLTADQLAARYAESCPEVTAASALLVNTTTGQILCEKNAHERRALASFTKITTALLALERGRMDDRITIQAGDLTVGSRALLRQNETYSMRDLLHALLVTSDNAAAVAIARHLAGSSATFVEWMNDLVASWGLEDTRYGNPHGLDHVDGYTTAYEAAILARYAMLNPTFADMVGRSEALVGGYLFASTNQLYGVYPGVKGVKTGTTDLAGECLIALVERPQGRVLVVVMGSTDRYTDTQRLLNYYYANYAELRLDLPENDLNRYLDTDGSWRHLYLADAATLLVPPWRMRAATLYRRIDRLDPNLLSQEPVGSLVVSIDGAVISEIPMYAR